MEDLSVNVYDGVCLEQSFGEDDLALDRHLHNYLNKGEGRAEQIARLFFIERKTVGAICQLLELKKSRVYQCISKYKKRIAKEYKRDEIKRDRIIDNMIDLQISSKMRMRTLWGHYEELKDDLERVRDLMKMEEERGGVFSEEWQKLFGLCMGLHSNLCKYMKRMAGESRTLLMIWNKFGLCDMNIKDLMSYGYGDVEGLFRGIRLHMDELIAIIEDGVSNEDERKKVFGKLAVSIEKIDRIISQAEDGEAC
ncbi:MAG: hypothetical protein ACOCUH_02340 [Bacteriovoracia bacterium]